MLIICFYLAVDLVDLFKAEGVFAFTGVFQFDLAAADGGYHPVPDALFFGDKIDFPVHKSLVSSDLSRTIDDLTFTHK